MDTTTETTQMTEAQYAEWSMANRCQCECWMHDDCGGCGHEVCGMPAMQERAWKTAAGVRHPRAK